MYRIMRVKSGKLPASEQKEQEQTARRVKWDEMVCILQHLEGEHGWGVVDATKVYTRDEDPSHKSMVLGELARCFPLYLLPRDDADAFSGGSAST